MPGTVGRNAVELPWLCPTTDSLITLAERPAEVAPFADADPGLLALLLRFDPYQASAFRHGPDRFQSPRLPDAAAYFLKHTPRGWPDPDNGAVADVLTLARTAAATARRVAALAGGVEPDAAAAVAVLAPLGWYAVGAVDPTALEAVLADQRFEADPTAAQVAHWGLDQDAVARRLAARWRLPVWVANVVGTLGLPLRVARGAVPDPALFAVVQLAVLEAEERVGRIGLTRGADRRESLISLGLDDDALATAVVTVEPPAASALDPNPHRVPLVRNLLRVCADARRRSGVSLAAHLEARVDELHRALAAQTDWAEARLRDARLAGLAELAAGAGHEINNPLAVISGHAQRMLAWEADPEVEPDPDRIAALQAIQKQAHRIHGIIRDLMQFARPGKPDRRPVAARGLLDAVRAELAPLADQRQVRLDVGDADCWLDADPGQVRHALAALVRNGVEAAAAGGWVRVDGPTAAGRHLLFAVEDSGPGVPADVAAHLFDPFYSGRSAGRGRGLGLSTAWRYARLNGGDLRFEPAADGPTRFVLTVPRAADEALRPERKSA